MKERKEAHAMRGGVIVMAIAFLGCGTIGESALNARASYLRACEQRSPEKVLSCYQAVPLLRDDEPKEGKCMGHNDPQLVGAGAWSDVAAPNCSVPSRLCSFQQSTTSQEAQLGSEQCLANDAELFRAAECIRDWHSAYANVHGASLSCTVEIERMRWQVAVVTERYRVAIAELRNKEEATRARKAREAAEVARTQAAQLTVAHAAELCKKEWRDQTSLCEAEALNDDERQRCEHDCRVAAETRMVLAFATALDVCVAEFAETARAANGCQIARPSASTVTTEEFDARRADCGAECKKQGPAARSRAIADKALAQAAARPVIDDETTRQLTGKPSPTSRCGEMVWPQHLGSGDGSFTILCDQVNGGGRCVLSRLGSGTFSESSVRRAAGSCCCKVQ